MSPVGSYFKSSEQVGISLLADPKYTRAWPGGCGDSKLGSNYGPTVQVHHKATEKGLQQVLWLYGEDQQVTEVGTMNIFMLYINDNGSKKRFKQTNDFRCDVIFCHLFFTLSFSEKELVTPPLNGLILPGVVRNSLLALAKEWNQFEVTERTFTMKEVIRLLSEGRVRKIYVFSMYIRALCLFLLSQIDLFPLQLLEMFGSGTACVVSPISYIDFVGQDLHIPTTEQPEPVYKMLLKSLLDIQYGVIPEHPWSLIVE